MPAETREILVGFGKKRVLVVGVLMLDEYIWGRVDRVSPEAPVIVVRVNSSECRSGGAAVQKLGVATVTQRETLETVKRSRGLTADS